MDVEKFVNPDWHELTPRFGRRILRTLLRDVAVFAMLVVVGEGAVRLFLPEYDRFRFSDTVTGGHPKAVNSWGLRDREFPEQWPPEQVRILCLGNSTTYGAGVAADDTYPKQLERGILNQRHAGDPYWVINGGGEGNSLDKAISFLERTGRDLDPSMAILGYSPSMMALTGRPGTSADAGQATVRKQASFALRCKRSLRRFALTCHGRLYGSYLYVFFDTNLRRRLYRLGVLRDRMDKPGGAIFAYAFDDPGVRLEEVEDSYRAFAETLAELKDLLGQRDVPLVLLGIPSRFDVSDEPCDNERGFDTRRIRINPLEHVREYCQQLGIYYLDLTPRLRTERQAMLRGQRPWDDLFIPFDYGHLNETSLHMAAEELLKVIDAHGWLPDRPT